MKIKFNHGIGSLAVVGVIAAYVMSCANMASPNGGPYDERPPILLRSTPRMNQTNFTGKRIEIIFDELVQIEQPSENVIITPPQKNLPEIRTAGKKIIVELKDTLKPDVTYTIDFTSSIVDNNEKNSVENFSFAFSTGEVIDSLEVSGIVLDASNLEPMAGILVGLHQDLADSAFTTTPFLRTSKTNEKGLFTIRNVSEGTYRIYALNDINRDYLFDQPGEAIAFLDTLIIPGFEPAIRNDTIRKDSLTVDTVHVVGYTRFTPDDIVLRLFKENFQRQYMLRPERSQRHLFTLKFNAPPDSLPIIELLNNQDSRDDWTITQIPDDPAIVNYWIKDSIISNKDTLHLSVTYFRTDSLLQLQLQTDTVPLIARRQQAVPQRRSRNNEPPPIDFLTMNVSASGLVEVFDTISITFPEPVLDITKDFFQLEIKQDTLWNPVEFDFRQDSVNVLRYYIERNWKYDESYRLNVDSAQIYSIYGKWNNTLQAAFQMKSKDTYGNFYLNIEGISEPAFVELLNASDAPVRKAIVKDGGVLFLNLKPDKYYVRLIVDVNENGIWDTGNYAKKIYPEEVYYSPVFYEMRANWDSQETWNVLSAPLSKQKPMDITKNKPKDVTRPRRDYKTEGQSQQSRSSSGMGGLGGLGRGIGL
ncbi:MAG: Ig-like domain-containing protein [Tannerella sp.]|nr:Ig-like domain-containing protein [Tannerella sp.]